LSLPSTHLRKPLYSLAGILAIYALLSLIQLDLPGLHYDEAFEAAPALDLLLGRPVIAFRNSGLSMAGRLFPYMTQDYIGALNTYLVLPFIAVVGATPLALRLMSVLVGAGTIWLAYKLSTALTQNHVVGLTAALLLAVDPTFIFWNRQGIFVTAITATIGLAACLCWLRRSQTQSVYWSAGGAFLFGLGLYAKLLFVWLLIALVGAVLLLNLKELFPVRHRSVAFWRPVRGELGIIPAAFILGCWPLIVYNIQTGGTFVNIIQNAQTSYYGVNNLAIGSNLTERLKQFFTLLGGGHLWYLGNIFNNPIPQFSFLLVLVGTGYVTTQNKQRKLNTPMNPVKVALFPFLAIGLVIPASIATVSALWLTHFAILMPWPAIALAIGGWFIYERLIQTQKERFRNLARRWLWIGLSLVVLSNLWSCIRYHQALAESGGLSTHSDAIYDLSEWLNKEVRGQVVAMDWGLAAPVTYLTGGQVSPIEIFGYAWEEPDANLTGRLEQFIAQPETLYLWRAPDEIIFDRSPEFKALYRPLQLEETIEAAFYERSGRPILGITRLVSLGTATNRPQ